MPHRSEDSNWVIGHDRFADDPAITSFYIGLTDVHVSLAMVIDDIDKSPARWDKFNKWPVGVHKKR